MDAKFQEYLDQISSEKYGEDVRSAIQHALVYLYDKFLRQGKTLAYEDIYADNLLDTVWNSIIEVATGSGISAERKNLIDNPEAEGGYNDLVAFTRDLVSFLRLFDSVIAHFPSLSDTSDISSLEQALDCAVDAHSVTEEIRLINVEGTLWYSGGQNLPNEGNFAVVPISDVREMDLTVTYNDLFPPMNDVVGRVTVPIICLSTVYPSDNIKEVAGYVLDKYSETRPNLRNIVNSIIPRITSFENLVADTVYKLDPNITYPDYFDIYTYQHPYTVTGHISKSQLNGVKCLILGQLNVASENWTSSKHETYYKSKLININQGILGSIYAKLDMIKSPYISR